MALYVALGDSTVEGLEDPGADGCYRGWADRLAEHLATQQPDLLYANLAVRGKTATQVRREQLPAALALRPDLAVVVAGVNDMLRPRFSPSMLRKELMEMHSALAGVGAQVVTFTMPDMAQVAPLARLLRARLHALNAVFHQVTQRCGTTLVDLAAHPVGADPRLWHSDRLHANALGHERIAAALAEALGVPVDGPHWSSALPPRQQSGKVVAWSGEVRWAARHLIPWAWRHLHGRSSGDAVMCKRPIPLPVSAQGTSDAVTP